VETFAFGCAVLVSSAALVCGASSFGCSSGAPASAPDTGVRDSVSDVAGSPPDTGVSDGGSDTGSDRTADGDPPSCSSPDALVRIIFQLPSESFSFDAQDWMIPPSTSTPIACGSGSAVADCCNPPAPAVPPDCATRPLVCEANVCTLEVDLAGAQPVDLKGDVPVLSDLGPSQLCEISLQRLSYAATSTLNVPLPGLRLYLGPDGVTDPRAPAAYLVGTIPAIPAGSSTSGNVISEPDFSQAFAAYAGVLGTRFMLMAAATVAVPSGSPQPTGTLTLTITGQASATTVSSQ
jgi:hypothetical protein